MGRNPKDNVTPVAYAANPKGNVTPVAYAAIIAYSAIGLTQKAFHIEAI